MQRLIYTVIVAFLFSLVIGPFVIPILKRLKVGQTINSYGPRSHSSKQGTATMGGIIFAVAAIAAALIFAGYRDLKAHMMAFCVITTLLFGAIGFVDDYIKVTKARAEGLAPKQKLIPQIVFAIAVSVFAYLNPYIGSSLRVPFTNAELRLGIFYIPIMAFVIVGVVNSSNLLDGLDGLCAGNSMIMFAAFALICVSLAAKKDGVDRDLFNTAIFSGAMCGALLGYLRFSTHPATTFMGDFGSFTIGGALVSVAIVTRLTLILPIVAFTMMLSSVSDLIQIGYMYTHKGKRLFRMTPIHHHFELSGIPETRIVTAYNMLTALMCLLALTAFVA